MNLKSAMAVLLPFLLPVLCAASCSCPSDFPYCYPNNRWCYKSASSGSYTSKCGGSCSSSGSCQCPGSYPYCSSNKWCYKSSTSYSYTSTCERKCSKSYSSSGGGGSCTCPSSHPYCYPKNKWCYASATSSSYSNTCGAKCTASGTSNGGGSSGGGAKSASGLGKFIADFVKTKLGQRVASKLQGTTQCWDLAMRAIEEARSRGYRIPFGNSGYVWSDKTVHYTQALPGDIAQFSSWYEKHGYSFRMTGYRHTAVVVEPYSTSKGAVITYDQNPHPVQKSEYHPKYRTRGTMIIYRLPGTKRTRLFSGEESVVETDGRGPSLWIMVSAVTLIGFVVSGVVLGRRKSRSTVDDSMPQGQQQTSWDDQEVLLAGSE